MVTVNASFFSRCKYLVFITFATDPADVVVGLEQSSATVTEGDVHSVCADLKALPAGGTEREISGPHTLRQVRLTVVWYD